MTDVSYVFAVFTMLRYVLHISGITRGKAEIDTKVLGDSADNCRHRSRTPAHCLQIENAAWLAAGTSLSQGHNDDCGPMGKWAES
jgi:hypothetical protein